MAGRSASAGTRVIMICQVAKPMCPKAPSVMKAAPILARVVPRSRTALISPKAAGTVRTAESMKTRAETKMASEWAAAISYNSAAGVSVPSCESIRAADNPASGKPMTASPVAVRPNRLGLVGVDMVFLLFVVVVDARSWRWSESSP